MRRVTKASMMLGSLSAVAVPFAAVSCNMSVGYKISLYNYEDYISEDSMEIINNDFDYKMFGDLPEFEQAIKSGRSAGGIGSDYYNAKLAKNGNIKKINFHKALKIPSTITDVKTELKSIYTDKVWEQMSKFDTYIGDADKDGKADHLWEYMIPYFTQSKVVAFNMDRGNWSPAEEAILSPSSGTSQQKQAAIEALFTDKSYLGILKTLKAHGYNNFVNNDYSRDNLMIGSEYGGNQFTGKLTESNYKQFTNNYVRTIEEGLGIDFNSSDDVISETSGTASLDHLLKTNENWGAAFLYNGDAQYAHFGGSQELEDEGAKIRFVTPNNPVFLLDGFVISSKLTEENIENNIYETMYKAAFKGYKSSVFSTSPEDMSAYKNYDYVGYTTPIKTVYNYVNDDTFISENDPNNGYFADDFVGISLLPIASGINDNKIIWPIDDKLQSDYTIYYEQLTQG